MKIIAIAAVDEEWGIGKNGELPWDHLEDRQYFKRVTMNCPCIMGRKTYEDLARYFTKNTLMPDRYPIVVSSTLVRGETVDYITPKPEPDVRYSRISTLVTQLPEIKDGDVDLSRWGYLSAKKTVRHTNVDVVETVDHAIELATSMEKHANVSDAMYFIGGSSIYQHVIQNGLADEVYLSHVPGKHGCDTFFPREGMENYVHYSTMTSPTTGIAYSIYTKKENNNE